MSNIKIWWTQHSADILFGGYTMMRLIEGLNKNNRVCNRNIRFPVLIFWHTRVRYFTFKNTIFRLKILKRSSWQKKRENPFSLYIYCWGLRIGVSDTGNKTVWCLKSQSIKITIFVHSRKRTKYLWRTDS